MFRQWLNAELSVRAITTEINSAESFGKIKEAGMYGMKDRLGVCEGNFHIYFGHGRAVTMSPSGLRARDVSRDPFGICRH
jgi:hypothetical protein